MGKNHTFFTKWTSVATIFTTNQNYDLFLVIFTGTNKIQVNSKIRVAYDISQYDMNLVITFIQTDWAVATNISHF